MKVRALPIVLLLVLVAGLLTAEPATWPQWRGPNGNGVSSETGWNPKCLEGGAQVLWTADIGTGYSNVVVSGGRLYAVGSADATHLRFWCLDAASGRTLWQKNLALGYGANDPMSTPAVDGDRLYAIATNGTVVCVSTADGSMKWKKRLGNEPKADVLVLDQQFGQASSPIVAGPLLLVNANSAGIALDKMSGDPVWDSGIAEAGVNTYASPTVARIDGKPLALFMGPASLGAVEPGTGKLSWSVPHAEKTEIIADPVTDGRLVFFATTTRSCVIDPTPAGPRVLWSRECLRADAATPVLVNGSLFGTDWMQYVNAGDWQVLKRPEWPFQCVDLQTGAIAWSVTMPHASLIAADGKLIILDVKGTLSVAEANPREFKVISSADVLRGASRPRVFATPPVLCDGRIYVRNYAGDLICIDARK
jgi:outer membrane protein assembly factor BamB